MIIVLSFYCSVTLFFMYLHIVVFYCIVLLLRIAVLLFFFVPSAEVITELTKLKRAVKKKLKKKKLKRKKTEAETLKILFEALSF